MIKYLGFNFKDSSDVSYKRETESEPLQRLRLSEAITRINPWINEESIKIVTYEIFKVQTYNTLDANEGELKTHSNGKKILIVCDRLLTGFDAPIVKVMYLANH